MMPIAEMVRELHEKGIPMEAILVAIDGAERASSTRHPPESTRHPPDTTIEKRRAWDREYRRQKRENPPESTRHPPDNEKTPLTIRSKKESKRGTRIDVGWTPSEPEKAFAKAEGFSDWEIQREAQKFRDYWLSAAGSKGIKLDWSATWRHWVCNSADRAGKAPTNLQANAAKPIAGFYAQADTPQLDAWDRLNRETTGKNLPRDRNGGWRVPSEWPPGHGELPLTDTEEIPLPKLRAIP